MGTQTALPGLLADDVLTGVFALAKAASRKERLAFRGHDSALQEIFLGIQQRLHPALLKDFVFSDSGPKPYCPILSESISRLQLSGLVGRENPDYEVVFLRPSAESYFDEVLKKRFSREDLAQLEQIATEFLRSIQLK